MNSPNAFWPNPDDLAHLFLQKHGSPDRVGWAPQRRFQSGYYLPADWYEALVSKLVQPGCAWLDVGGGHQLFPDNPRLARELVSRCTRVVAVDPSDNVLRNSFVHERVQAFLEDYHSSQPFDLATMRMVVEHVAAPDLFVTALARLIRPGGLAVVFTVYRYAPITTLSACLPYQVHHPIKQLFWGGDKEDTFPVQYKMNTRQALRGLFAQAGFREVTFARLDDLSTFGRFSGLNRIELLLWRFCKRIGMTYPESCLLAVYQKTG